jgi:hypothetical protein
VLRRIVLSQREKVTIVKRKLRSENFIICTLHQILLPSPRKMRWAGHVPHKEMRNVYKIFVENPELMRPLGDVELKRPLGDVGVDGTTVLEIVCEGVDWIQLAHCRIHSPPLVNTVMNLRVPGNFLTS